jgi:hypothetical protein
MPDYTKQEWSRDYTCYHDRRCWVSVSGAADSRGRAAPLGRSLMQKSEQPQDNNETKRDPEQPEQKSSRHNKYRLSLGICERADPTEEGCKSHTSSRMLSPRLNLRAKHPEDSAEAPFNSSAALSPDAGHAEQLPQWQKYAHHCCENETRRW